jgi:hypothetical protein
MKKRIAVCLSGELRCFDHPLVQEGFTSFIEKHNPDIFISTWDHIGKSMNHQYIDPFEEKQIHNDIESRLKSIYNNCKNIEIENYNSWINLINPEIANIITNITYDSRTVNSYTQLYKIYKANQLKIQQEISNGYCYDLVIRSRPDNLFISNIEVNQVTPHTIYNINLKGNFYPNRIYDIMFYGDSFTMDLVSKTYLHYTQLIQHPFNNGLCDRDTCRLLYLQAINNNILVESTKNRPCDVYRDQTFDEYYNLLKGWGGLD